MSQLGPTDCHVCPRCGLTRASARGQVELGAGHYPWHWGARRSQRRDLSFDLLWSLESCPVAFGQLSASVTESQGRIVGQIRSTAPLEILQGLWSVPLPQSLWERLVAGPGPGRGRAPSQATPACYPHTLSSDNHSGVTWIQLLRAQMNPTSRNRHSGA